MLLAWGKWCERAGQAASIQARDIPTFAHVCLAIAICAKLKPFMCIRVSV